MSVSVDKPLSVVVVYGLALVAIHKASQRGLTKHIRRLQPDKQDEQAKDEKAKSDGEEVETTSSASEAESQPAKEDKPRSKWERWRDGLAAAGMVLVMWGFGLLMAFGLPKIATPTVLDIVWMLLVGHQVCLVYEQLIASILPDPRCFEVHWVRWNTITWIEIKTVPPGDPPRSTKRRVVAGVLALATVTGVYAGMEWMITFPLSALVYAAVASIAVVDRPVRSTFKWMMIIQVALIGSTALVMGGIRLYRLYFSKDKSAPDTSEAKPSPEVLLLMMMCSTAIPLVVSGCLIGLGLRFDYNQALKSGLLCAPTISASTRFVKLAPYPKPSFQAGLQTLIGILVTYGVSQAFPLSPIVKDIGLMAYAVCLPATIIAVRMMLVAAREGVWEEFMGYTELGAKALKEQRAEDMDMERTERDVTSSEKELLDLDVQRP